jgi:hypothetical protein
LMRTMGRRMDVRPAPPFLTYQSTPEHNGFRATAMVSTL